MAGEFEVYKNCPCGSGKKLKFCCHAIIGDMQKVSEMRQHHQYEMALTVLDNLEKRGLKEVWSRAWVKTNKALIQSSLQRHDEARQLVCDVLDELPGHPLATAVNALLTLSAEGYPAAKRAIYDAFEIPAENGRNTYLTAHLARTLASVLAAQGHPLAAREHYALAGVIDPQYEEAVEDFFEYLRDTSIAYPFRSQYALASFSGDESQKAAYDEAMEFARAGCFSDAAKTFGSIARQVPQQAWVWWNIALCHAWAAEDPLAVEAFKAAAANQPDIEAAADCLLLSRLLRPPVGAARAERVAQDYRVTSVSRLLTRLDQEPRYARGADSSEDEDEVRPVAWYQILDRDPAPVAAEALSVESVPKILGQIVIFDASAEKPSHVVIGCLGREHLEPLKQQFAAIAGDDVEITGEPIVVGVIRAESAALQVPWRLPDDLSLAQVERLQQQRQNKIVDELWLQTPQEALNGKSPAEAAKSPELQTALMAAVLALDTYIEQAGSTLDLPAVRSRLGLPAVTPLDTSPDCDPRALSILEVRRLPFDRLTDVQLLVVVNSALRTGHSVNCDRAIREVLTRPTVTAEIDPSQLQMLLASLCRRRFRSDEALEWLAKGKAEAKARKQPLESLLLWEFEELILRAGSPDDPKLAEIAATLWNYYRPKLPNAAELIAGMLQQMPVPGPWNAAGSPIGEPEALATAGATSAAGLWTPEAQGSGPASRLWLPGQE